MTYISSTETLLFASSESGGVEQQTKGKCDVHTFPGLGGVRVRAVLACSVLLASGRTPHALHVALQDFPFSCSLRMLPKGTSEMAHAEG
jgi:hypothetical protein